MVTASIPRSGKPLRVSSEHNELAWCPGVTSDQWRDRIASGWVVEVLIGHGQSKTPPPPGRPTGSYLLTGTACPEGTRTGLLFYRTS